jgi:acyl carrier protein
MGTEQSHVTSGIDPVHQMVKRAIQVEQDGGWDDSTALEDLPKMDSLAHMRLIGEIERAVGATLTIEEIIGIAYVEDIRALLKAKGIHV